MSWINVLWQDPEEGHAYDVWTATKGRIIDCEVENGKFFEISTGDRVHGVTHFMPSPEPPKD